MNIRKVGFLTLMGLGFFVCVRVLWFDSVRFEGHDCPIENGISSPDGSILATRNDDLSTITLCDQTTGEKRSLVGQHGILCIAFSPDGTTLASGGLDNTLWLWDAATGNRRFLEKPWWLGDTSVDYPTFVGFSPDGKTLASIVDRRVGVWDVESGKHLATLEWCFHAATFTADGKLVALLQANDQSALGVEQGVKIIEEPYAGPVCLGAVTLAVIIFLGRGRGVRPISRRFARSGSIRTPQADRLIAKLVD